MKNKLPKAFKKKWVAALRSGKYNQGASLLYNSNNNGYCCLGVACAILGIPDESLRGHGTIPLNKFNGIPELITGSAKNHNIVAKLIHFNDGFNDKTLDSQTPKSFNWIASYIERYL